MVHDRDRQRSHATPSVDLEPDRLAPGRITRTAQLAGPGPRASGFVQRKGDAHTGLDDDAVRAVAARGISGSGGPLPHLDAIQRSFGRHDVTGVRAHVGSAASAASRALGAEAYATGNDVAFASSPNLFVAAHEAAHVVQQRAGVSLKSAIGEAGDAYERHADAVAERVVRGESAAELLAAGPSGGAHVQRKDKPADPIFAPGGIGGSAIKPPPPKPAPEPAVYDLAEIDWGQMALARKHEDIKPAPKTLAIHTRPKLDPEEIMRSAKGHEDGRISDEESRFLDENKPILAKAKSSLAVFAKDVKTAESRWNTASPEMTAYFDVANSSDLEKMYGLTKASGAGESLDAVLDRTSVQTASGNNVSVGSVFDDSGALAMSPSESAGIPKAKADSTVKQRSGELDSADYGVIAALEDVAGCVDRKLARAAAVQAACLNLQLDAEMTVKAERAGRLEEWKTKRERLVGAVTAIKDVAALALGAAGGVEAVFGLGEAGGPVQLSLFEENVHPVGDYAKKLGKSLAEHYKDGAIDRLISVIGDVAYREQIDAAQSAVDAAGEDIRRMTDEVLKINIYAEIRLDSAAAHDLGKAQALLSQASCDRFRAYIALGGAAANASGLPVSGKDRLEAAVSMIPMVEFFVAKARRAQGLLKHPYYSAPSGIGANVAEQDGVDLTPFADTVGGLVGWKDHIELALGTWVPRLDTLHELREQLRPVTTTTPPPTR